MIAVNVGMTVSRDSKRWNGSVAIAPSSQVWSADLFKISRTVVSETGVKDKRCLPLKSLSRGCGAQRYGCGAQTWVPRPDRILLILFRKNSEDRLGRSHEWNDDWKLWAFVLNFLSFLHSRHNKDTVNYCVLINKFSELMGDEPILLGKQQQQHMYGGRQVSSS